MGLLRVPTHRAEGYLVAVSLSQAFRRDSLTRSRLPRGSDPGAGAGRGCTSSSPSTSPYRDRPGRTPWSGPGAVRRGWSPGRTAPMPWRCYATVARTVPTPRKGSADVGNLLAACIFVPVRQINAVASGSWSTWPR